MKHTVTPQLEELIRQALGLSPVRTATCPTMHVCTVREKRPEAHDFLIGEDGTEGRVFKLTQSATQMVIENGDLKEREKPSAPPAIGSVLIVFSAAYNADCKRCKCWGYHADLSAFKPKPAFGSLAHALGDVDGAEFSLDMVATITDADLSPPSDEELAKARLTVVEDKPEAVASVTADGIIIDDEEVKDTRTSRRLAPEAMKIPRVKPKQLRALPSPTSTPIKQAKPAEGEPLFVRLRKQAGG